MLEIAEAMDRYGVSLVITGAVIWAVVWGVRRMLNPKDGLLTRVAEKHIESLDATKECQQSMTRSLEKLSDQAVESSRNDEKHAEHLEALANQHQSVARAGRHACDVLEKICRELGIEDASKHSIAEIRRELDSTVRPELVTPSSDPVRD